MNKAKLVTILSTTVVCFLLFALVSCTSPASAPNNPPSKPSNPSPANGETNVSMTPTLCWSCSDPDGDTLAYDIYFGTDQNLTTPVESNHTNTSYQPGTLASNTTYYWKIVAKDGKGGVTEGDLWSFTTAITWAKCYGGNNADEAWSVQQTSDGGYIVAGYTYPTAAGANDVYILKLDENGNKLWEKTYGGSEYDEASSIQQTSDGGYIVAGYTTSSDTGEDVYILKLDSEGNL